MRVAPTTAEQPAAEGIAMLIKYVSIVVIGIKTKPMFLSGLVSSVTRCWSHLVYFITKAKPMLAQIAFMSPALVIYSVNALSAPIGFNATTQSISPTAMSTVLVSLFLIKRYMTAMTPKTDKINFKVCILSPFKF